MMKSKRRVSGAISRVVVIGMIALLLGTAVFAIYYVNDYYHSEDIVNEYLQGTETVAVSEIKEGLFLDGDGEESAMIFYPGAKVEYTAYLPLFMELAEEGVDCFLVEMPCNLAILGMNKASGIMDSYDYENWYLAGHSLGGAMAANYAAEKYNALNGLVLLAAYPTKNLDVSAFEVLSIYGSEDAVLNMEKLEEGRNYMPEAYVEVCIEGGNHAQFGAYGVQEGDGTATISREEQLQQTLEAILTMIEE